MAELAALLNRFFVEVNPVFTQAKKAKAKQAYMGSLFEQEVRYGYVQVWPGYFVHAPQAGAEERPCLFVVDAPAPLLLPGLATDFLAAEFLYPVYQIPVYAGAGKHKAFNIEPRLVDKVVQQEQLASAKELDKAMQALLAEVATSGLLAKTVHALAEAVRVWSLDDYVKVDFLTGVRQALGKLRPELETATDKLLVPALQSSLQRAEKLVDITLSTVSKKSPALDVFVQAFAQILPMFKDETLGDILKGLVLSPLATRGHLSQAEGALPAWLSTYNKPKKTAENLYNNAAYLRFIELQLAYSKD